MYAIMRKTPTNAYQIGPSTPNLHYITTYLPKRLTPTVENYSYQFPFHLLGDIHPSGSRRDEACHSVPPLSSVQSPDCRSHGRSHAPIAEPLELPPLLSFRQVTPRLGTITSAFRFALTPRPLMSRSNLPHFLLLSFTSNSPSFFALPLSQLPPHEIVTNSWNKK